MTPCPLCQHVPYVDSTPVSDGWNTVCGNCGQQLWDVTTAPRVVNRAYEAKQRDIWDGLSILCMGLATVEGVHPTVAEIYRECKEFAEEASERAQDATYTDSAFTAAFNRLRGL